MQRRDMRLRVRKSQPSGSEVVLMLLAGEKPQLINPKRLRHKEVERLQVNVEVEGESLKVESASWRPEQAAN